MTFSISFISSFFKSLYKFKSFCVHSAFWLAFAFIECSISCTVKNYVLFYVATRNIYIIIHVHVCACMYFMTWYIHVYTCTIVHTVFSLLVSIIHYLQVWPHCIHNSVLLHMFFSSFLRYRLFC